MATNTGTSIVNQGGQATRQGGAVHIDRDVTPAWETGALPGWVVHTLIPLLAAGQKWPEASESKLSELAQAWEVLAAGLTPHAEPAGKSVRTIVAGWQAPATADFVTRAQHMFGKEAGLQGISRGARGYSAQVSNFAVETQYSKLSVNVAFWVTAIAIAIAMYVAFFTAGSTTPLIGPYASAGRAAIGRILARLAAVAGRKAGSTQVAKLAALNGPTGGSLIARLLASPLGRELIEEMGEEFVIDGVAQYQQIQMGTRTEWDWDKSKAALLGAGTGAVVGMKLAGPVSKITNNVPGFAGRALNTGLSNMAASPAGSFVANGVVYGQWTNPFSAESLSGAFFGGVGRTGSISPFNPEVYTTLSNPGTALASAYDMAAQSDARRMGLNIDPNAGGDATGAGGTPGGPGGGGAGSAVVGGGSGQGGGRASGGATRGGSSASTSSGGGTASRTAPVTADAEDGGRRAATPSADAEGRGNRRSQPENETRTDAEANPDPDTKADTSADTAPSAANDTKADTSADTAPSAANDTKTAANGDTKADTSADTLADTGGRAATDTDQAAVSTPDEQARDTPGEQETRSRVAVSDDEATTPDPQQDATTSPDTRPDGTARTQPEAAPAAPETQPDATPDQRTDPAPAAPDTETGTGETRTDGAPTTDTGTTQDTAPAPDSGTDTDTGAAVAPNSTPDARPAPDAASDTAQNRAPDAAQNTAPDTAQDTAPEEGAPSTLAQDEAAFHTARAREAVVRALLDAHPGTVLLPDGGLIVPLTGADIVVSPAAMARIIDRVGRRSPQVEDDEALQAEALTLLDEQLATDTAPEDAYAADLVPGQPVGLRANAALDYALNRLAPGAVLLADGGHLVSDESGHYVITPRMLRAVRSVLEAAAASDQDAATLRSRALLVVSQAMAVSQDTSPAPEPVTSRPGTVTSRPIAGTRYVTDGRQTQRLTDDEIRTAIDELIASDFHGDEVTDWNWSPDNSTLVVETRNHGVQRFQFLLGGLDSRLMAETHVNRRGGAHVVHFAAHIAPDQLPRVWLHEITDTLHALSRPEQGIIRRSLFRRGRQQNHVDGCVPARLNEHAYLARKWRAATSSDERWNIQVDLDGVARDLRAHGQTPPPAPWGATPHVRGVQTPPAVAENATATELERVIEELHRAEGKLKEAAKAHKEIARKAAIEAGVAGRESRETGGRRDQGSATRARKKNREREQHRAKRDRHLRIGRMYSEAHKQAEATRLAYARALAFMQMAAGPNANEAALARGRVADAVSTARQQHDSYLKAVEQALPRVGTMPAALPTGVLPHLTALTDQVNQVLADQGARRRYTPKELEHILRADFRRVVSEDGLVLRAGTGRKSFELKIQLKVSDMIEIIDPDVKASEIMLGTLPQGGMSVQGAEAGKGGGSLGFDTRMLAQFLPQDSPMQMFLASASVGFNYDAGRNWSRNSSAAEYFLGGAVEDNRSESLLFDAAGRWEISVRESQRHPWRQVAAVDQGAPGDSTSLRFWVSHVYADQAPVNTKFLPEAERNNVMPEHVVSDLTGLRQLADQIVDQVSKERQKVDLSVGGRARAKVTEDLLGDAGRAVREAAGSPPTLDENVRRQIHTFITETLRGELREAVNDTLTAVITDSRGRPLMTVTVDTTVDMDSAELVGHPSRDHWQERLRVGFSTANGGESYGGSRGGGVSSALGIPSGDVQVYGDHDYAVGPTAKGGRSKSRSASAFANGQAIHPSVQRYTGYTQGYELKLTHKVTVQMARDSEPLETLSGDSTALIRMPETDAYRYGLPVDEAALQTPDGKPLPKRNGVQVLRSDPDPSAPPGRKPDLPLWLGHPTGSTTAQPLMRGAGPALVQQVEGLTPLKKKIYKELAELGVLPEIDASGKVTYSSDPLERASQMLNLHEVNEQLSARSVETNYDLLAQDGLEFSLTHFKGLASPKTCVVRLNLTQDFDSWNYIGHTDSEAIANLYIGSDTAGRANGTTWTKSWGASGSFTDGPPKDVEGRTDSHKPGYDGNRPRTVGSSTAGTGNVVTLNETDHVAIGEVDHVMEATITYDGVKKDPLSEPGKARLVFPVDLLPPSNGEAPHPIGRPTDELMARATLLHMDTTGMLALAEELLPNGMAADSPARAHLAAFLDVRSLIAHPEWRPQGGSTEGEYGTSAAVRPKGVLPSESSLQVEGEFGEARLLGVADLVGGRINLTLGSAGVSWGGTWGGTRSASLGESYGESTSEGDGSWSHGGSMDRGRSASVTGSHGELDIWGRERLEIYGRQYIFDGTVDFTLTGSEGHPNPVVAGSVLQGDPQEKQHPGRPVLFSVPEYDVLTMYAEGKLKLPLHVVADAVERFRDGNLKLDRTLATGLLQRYLTDRRQAVQDNKPLGLAAGHTPDVLLNALTKVKDLEKVAEGLGPQSAAQSAPQPATGQGGASQSGQQSSQGGQQSGTQGNPAQGGNPQGGQQSSQGGQQSSQQSGQSSQQGTQQGGQQAAPQSMTPDERIDAALSRARDVVQRLSEVYLAPHYVGAMGLSVVESFTVTNPEDNDNPISVLDAVRAAVEEVAPQALQRSPVMSRSLRGDLAGTRPEGHLDAMLSARGFVKSYETLADPATGRAELVTVRARLVPVDSKTASHAELLGHIPDGGFIVQDYGYREVTDSQSAGRSGNVSGGYSHGAADFGESGGGSTHRGGSFSENQAEQFTKMQRFSQFNGLDRVKQSFRLEIEVERTPLRRGPVRTTVREKVDLIRRRPTATAKFTYDADLVRRTPTGMTRARSESKTEPDPVVDHRRVELPPAHFVNSVQHDADPDHNLFAVIETKLSEMMDAASVQERIAELEARLSPVSISAAFAKMVGPGGHELVRMARKHFRSQGVDVRVEAHLSDLQVVSAPFEAEIGEVDRIMRTLNVSMSRSHLWPGSGNVGGSSGVAGVSGGTSFGDQASAAVSAVTGLRNEASKFEKGKVVVVRVRVDYDLTFQHKARLPGGDEKVVKDPVHLPAAARGEAYLVVFESSLKTLNARMEAGIRARPGWDFTDESQPRSQLRPPTGPHQQLDPKDLLGHVARARQQARDEGHVVRFVVGDGRHVDVYLAAPDGSLHSVKPDGGFAEALATLPPLVLNAAAAEKDIDLLSVFQNSPAGTTFTEQVVAALAAKNVTVDPKAPVWPSETGAASSTQGAGAGQSATGISAGGAPSPALPDTPFDTQARPAGVPDLSVTEMVGQNISVADFGGGVTALDWTTDQGVPIDPDAPPADLDGAVVAVTTPANGVQHARVVVGDPGEDRIGYTSYRSGTPEDPHVITIAPRTDPAVVSSVLVHEISHVADQHAAEAAGAPQGVIRPSLPEHTHEEGTDHCLTPRLNEHAHLSRKWSETADPAARARIAEAIDAIADDITRRGHTPPAPPWQATETAAEARPKPSIADLLNGDASPAPAAPPAAQTRLLTLPERVAADMGASVRRPDGGLLEAAAPGRATVTVRGASAPDASAQENAEGTAVVDVRVRPDARVAAGARPDTPSSTGERPVPGYLDRMLNRDSPSGPPKDATHLAGNPSASAQPHEAPGPASRDASRAGSAPHDPAASGAVPPRRPGDGAPPAGPPRSSDSGHGVPPGDRTADLRPREDGRTADLRREDDRTARLHLREDDASAPRGADGPHPDGDGLASSRMAELLAELTAAREREPRIPRWLDGIHSGIAEVPVLLGGRTGRADGVKHTWSDLVERWTFNDGSRMVRKVMATPEEADSEVLASIVGIALGADVPGVYRAGDRVIYQEFKEGQHRVALPSEEVPTRPELTRSGMRISVLDVLVCNRDRHALNWLLSPEPRTPTGQRIGVIGIDHNLCFEDPQTWAPKGDFGTQFLRSVRSPDGAHMRYVWRPNPLSPEDVQGIKRVLKDPKIKWEFERRGRLDWYLNMLSQLGMIERNAVGTKPIMPMPVRAVPKVITRPERDPLDPEE
ncbi:WXG100-like domain-containing protein [Microtetraspora niveoalba]|uniref:WXG100-like domain-containing protein n=1 Tax=Microtetraspora niveoalba TaxID=46175 RepID=UPI00082A5F18|nr:hypothetical protein [Microtetraspora niveoalba]